MIRVQVNQFIQRNTNPTTPEILKALDETLVRTKFFGKIELTYESGDLKFVRATQSFTPDSLIEHLKI